MWNKAGIFNKTKNKFLCEAIVADSPHKRARGLMFRDEKALPILFLLPKKQCYALHSIFVFFDFYIIYMEDGGVVEKREAKPFEPYIYTSCPANQILEIPALGNENKSIYSGIAINDILVWNAESNK